LALLALAWLAAMLWTSEGTVGWAVDGNGFEVVTAAQALPGVVTATLVGGAAVGLGAVNLLAARRGRGGRRGPDEWRLRLAAGAGTGLLTGAVVATLVTLGYDKLPSIAGVAVAVAAVGTIGGALAALPPVRVVAAGVAGALGVFAVTLLLN